MLSYMLHITNVCLVRLKLQRNQFRHELMQSNVWFGLAVIDSISCSLWLTYYSLVSFSGALDRIVIDEVSRAIDSLILY